MSYQRYYLVAAVLASLLPARDATTSPLHQHHGHHTLEENSLVKFGDEDFGTDVLSRDRRGLKDKINLLGVIGQLYTEQREDQEQAVQKITGLLSDSIAPEPSNQATTARPTSSDGGEETTTEASGSSTTAGPYKATASQLMTVLRRNIVGLRNLFTKEWRIAMEDSNKNTAAAKAEFKDSIRPFFRKNGTASG